MNWPPLVTALLLLFSIAASASLPATAQYEFGRNGTRDYLKSRIDAGGRAGVITRTEVQKLRTCLNRVSYLESHGSSYELASLSCQMRLYIDNKERRHGEKYRLERHKRAGYDKPVVSPFNLKQYRQAAGNLHILRSNSEMAMKYAQQFQ